MRHISDEDVMGSLTMLRYPVWIGELGNALGMEYVEEVAEAYGDRPRELHSQGLSPDETATVLRGERPSGGGRAIELDLDDVRYEMRRRREERAFDEECAAIDEAELDDRWGGWRE